MPAPRPGALQRLAVAQRTSWRGSAAGTVQSARPVPAGGGNRLEVIQDGRDAAAEHVTAYVVPGLTIPDGGGKLMVRQQAGPPTERVGFDAFAAAAAHGPVGDIPINVTGFAVVKVRRRLLKPLGGNLTIRRTRDGQPVDHTFAMGTPARLFDEVLPRFEVRAGDTLAVIHANDTGAGVGLDDTDPKDNLVDVAVWHAAGPASPPPPPTSELVDFTWDHSGAAAGTVDRPPGAEPGDLLVALMGGDSSAPTSPTVAGFDFVVQSRFNRGDAALFTRVVQESEPSDYAWSGMWTGAGVLVALIRNGSPSNLVHVTGGGGAGPLAMPEIVAPGAGVFLLGFGSNGNTTYTVPSATLLQDGGWGDHWYQLTDGAARTLSSSGASAVAFIGVAV